MTINELHNQVNLAIKLLEQNSNYKKMMKEFWNRCDIKKSIISAQEKIINKYYDCKENTKYNT